MTYVRRAVHECAGCAERPFPTYKHTAKPALRPILTSRPFEKVFFDVTYMPIDEQDHHRYILVVVDHFTKFMWTKSFKRRTAEEISQFLHSIFGSEGRPYMVVSDNGTEFVAEVTRMVLYHMGSHVARSRPYHPPT